MLDLAGIIVSSLMMLFVVFRAVQLDAVLPWFGGPKSESGSSGLRLRHGVDESDDPTPGKIISDVPKRRRARPDAE